MATPRLTPDQINQVSGLVAQYIASQREKYVSRAVPLSAQQRAALDSFFSSQLLESTRALVLRGERVANPDFYSMLKGLGFKNLLTNLEWEQSHSAMSWFPMNRSTTVSCFTNSSMWNSIGTSASSVSLTFTYVGF